MTTTLPLTYKVGNCYLNALINSRHHYKDKKLRLVIGSLSINGWFEYGHNKWTTKDFLMRVDGYSSDSHAWLEDDEGNVYDYLYDEYEDWVMIRTKRPMKRKGILEGVSKEELAKDEVIYLPASKEVQKALFLVSFKKMKEFEEGLMKGTHTWNGNSLAVDLKHMNMNDFHSITIGDKTIDRTQMGETAFSILRTLIEAQQKL